LRATKSNHSRTVELQVKTKRKGNWHTSTDEAKPTDTPVDLEDVRNFWVFVDFGGAPRYWIVPDWWIRNDIIDESRLKNWQNNWEILGIF
jgi:hypothetical protein